jgi:hypothetical protein
VEELSGITISVLVVTGNDDHYPRKIGEDIVRVDGRAKMASSDFTADLQTSNDIAERFAKEVSNFIEAYRPSVIEQS